jgi:MFS family permease
MAEVSNSVKTSSPSRLATTMRALKHRNFQLFFSGQLISLIGTWMQTVAESWLVYRLTGSSLLLGSVAFASQIPVFLMAPLGGTVADRFNRHRIIITTQCSAMVLALTYSALTISGYIRSTRIWPIFVLAALLGIVNAFDIPARQAFIVEMVGREDLMNAIALNSSMFNGARVIGPSVAGIIVAKIGEGWCFFANGLSYIAVIAGLLMMHVTLKRREHTASPIENILEGFRYVRNTRPIRILLLLLGLVSLVGMPYAVLMPVFAKQILHGGARELGILMGATGVGALLGALTLAARTGLKGISVWINAASAGFGLSLILFCSTAYFLSNHFWLAAATLVPVGFSMMTQMACSNTLIQSMVPDHLRGRVMSVYSMMFMGMAPFGAFLAGWLSHLLGQPNLFGPRLGAPLTVGIGGVACLCGSAAFGTILSKFRVEARQLVLAQQEVGGSPPQQMTPQGVSLTGSED